MIKYSEDSLAKQLCCSCALYPTEAGQLECGHFLCKACQECEGLKEISKMVCGKEGVYYCNICKHGYAKTVENKKLPPVLSSTTVERSNKCHVHNVLIDRFSNDGVPRCVLCNPDLKDTISLTNACISTNEKLDEAKRIIDNLSLARERCDTEKLRDQVIQNYDNIIETLLKLKKEALEQISKLENAMKEKTQLVKIIERDCREQWKKLEQSYNNSVDGSNLAMIGQSMKIADGMSSSLKTLFPPDKAVVPTIKFDSDIITLNGCQFEIPRNFHSSDDVDLDDDNCDAFSDEESNGNRNDEDVNQDGFDLPKRRHDNTDSPKCSYRIGTSLLLGADGKMDEKRAVEIFERASNDDYFSKARLAVCLMTGQGCPVDRPRAVEIAKNVEKPLNEAIAECCGRGYVCMALFTLHGLLKEADSAVAETLFRQSQGYNEIEGCLHLAAINLEQNKLADVERCLDMPDCDKFLEESFLRGKVAMVRARSCFNEMKQKEQMQEEESRRRLRDEPEDSKRIAETTSLIEEMRQEFQKHASNAVAHFKEAAQRGHQRAAQELLDGIFDGIVDPEVVSFSDLYTWLKPLVETLDESDQTRKRFNEYVMLGYEAENGNSAKIGELAKMFHEGKHIPKNVPQFLKWVKKGVENHDATSLYMLGFVQLKGRDVEMDEKGGLSRIEASADMGNADAQYYLGMLYRQGSYVEKNPSKAMEFFKNARENGSAQASGMLGVLYYTGAVNGRKDFAEAVKYFKEAVDKNVPEAMHNLGACYLQGHGVDKDPEKAKELFQRGADLGHKGCASILTKLRM